MHQVQTLSNLDTFDPQGNSSINNSVDEIADFFKSSTALLPMTNNNIHQSAKLPTVKKVFRLICVMLDFSLPS